MEIENAYFAHETNRGRQPTVYFLREIGMAWSDTLLAFYYAKANIQLIQSLYYDFFSFAILRKSLCPFLLSINSTESFPAYIGTPLFGNERRTLYPFASSS